MIAAKTEPAAAGFAARLARKAAALAEARAEDRLRAARADPSRWRQPRLLWPLFAKG